MLSPAAAHRERVNKVHAVQSNNEMMTIRQFGAERRSISNIRSRARSAVAKGKAVLHYQAWIQTFIQSNNAVYEAENMFVWLLIWKIDSGHWMQAVEMAAVALERGLLAPKGFERTLVETLVEDIVTAIHQKKQQVEQVKLLDRLAVLVRGHDMFDPITAKLYRARGIAYKASHPEKAKQYFLKALEIYPKAGVKRDLQSVNRQLNASSPAETVKKITPADVAKRYSLSARKAAQRLGVSTPTIIRHAKKNPDLLPCLSIKTGKRMLYRFASIDIDRYKRKHLSKGN